MYYPKRVDIRKIQKVVGTGVGDYVYVDIDGEEYAECCRVKFWSEGKTGGYGSGVGNTPEDPKRVSRIGALGQMAFSKLLGIEFDNEYKEFGDEYDNKVCGLTLDIKCAMYNRGSMIVYAVSEGGVRREIDKDIYIGCFMDKEDRAGGTARIIFGGFMYGEDVRGYPTVPGVKRGSTHKIKLVPFEDLLSMDLLFDIFEESGQRVRDWEDMGR